MNFENIQNIQKKDDKYCVSSYIRQLGLNIEQYGSVLSDKRDELIDVVRGYFAEQNSCCEPGILYRDTKIKVESKYKDLFDSVNDIITSIHKSNIDLINESSYSCDEIKDIKLFTICKINEHIYSIKEPEFDERIASFLEPRDSDIIYTGIPSIDYLKSPKSYKTDDVMFV